MRKMQTTSGIYILPTSGRNFGESGGGGPVRARLIPATSRLVAVPLTTPPKRRVLMAPVLKARPIQQQLPAQAVYRPVQRKQTLSAIVDNSNASELDLDEVYQLLDEHSNNKALLKQAQQQQHQPRRRERLTGLSTEEKLNRRKMKNRIAAQAARDRKKETTHRLEDSLKRSLSEIKHLRHEVSALRQTNEQLQLENAKLKRQQPAVDVFRGDVKEYGVAGFELTNFDSTFGSAEGSGAVGGGQPTIVATGGKQTATNNRAMLSDSSSVYAPKQQQLQYHHNHQHQQQEVNHYQQQHQFYQQAPGEMPSETVADNLCGLEASHDELQSIFDDLFEGISDPDIDKFCNEVIEEGLVQTAQTDAGKSTGPVVKDAAVGYAHANPSPAVAYGGGRRYPKTEVQTEDFNFGLIPASEPMFGVGGGGSGGAEYPCGGVPSALTMAAVNNGRRQHSPYHQVPTQSPTADEAKFMPSHQNPYNQPQFSTYHHQQPPSSYSTTTHSSPTSAEGYYFISNDEDPVLFGDENGEKAKDQFELMDEMMMEVAEETVIDSDDFSQYDFSSPEHFNVEEKQSFQVQNHQQQGFSDNFDLREFL